VKKWVLGYCGFLRMARKATFQFCPSSHSSLHARHLIAAGLWVMKSVEPLLLVPMSLTASKY
jgi:hypothetical protein